MADNVFKAARKASDMTISQAADAAGLAAVTYPMRENEPGNFRLKELGGLYNSMNEIGKGILKDAVVNFFCE